MNHCSIHPGFYKTANTPCPACREEFNADIPLAGSQATPHKFPAARLEQQKADIRVLQEALDRANRSLGVYSTVALVGWAVAVGTLIYWIAMERILS